MGVVFSLRGGEETSVLIVIKWLPNYTTSMYNQNEIHCHIVTHVLTITEMMISLKRFLVD